MKIASIDARTFRVAEWRTAACAGDSSGPALMRDVDGRVMVAGLLSPWRRRVPRAAFYIRTASATGWLAPGTASHLECGAGGSRSLGRGKRLFRQDNRLVRIGPGVRRGVRWEFDLRVLARRSRIQCVARGLVVRAGVSHFGECVVETKGAAASTEASSFSSANSAEQPVSSR
jgi:hypothetical protein